MTATTFDVNVDANCFVCVMLNVTFCKRDGQLVVG